MQVVLIIFFILATLFIIKQNYNMALSQAELAAKLEAATAKVTKIGTEVQALKDIIVSQGNVTPEVEAALASLETALTGVDDLNPDAPVEG